MNLLLLATLVLSAYNPSALEGRDFYNAGSDLISDSYTTAGPPTAYVYVGSYDEPDYVNFDDINILKVPYQLSIDHSRIQHLTLRIHLTTFYMTPLASPTYEYYYFSIYEPTAPSDYYRQPFRYFMNSGDTDYNLTIPTTHESNMAIQFLQEIVFMNSLAYAEEFQNTAYLDGFDDGYHDGAFDGYQDGYNEGFDEGVIAGDTPQEWQGLFGILRSGFNSLSSILQIQLLPGFTLGLLLFLPLIFGVAYSIIRLFMRGG